MSFNVWTFLFEVLNFLVLAFVLHRLLYRPLRAAIDRRQAENDRAGTEAEAARKAADDTRAQLAEKLAATDRDRMEVLRKAAEQAGADTTRRLAEAEAAAQTVREQARHEAERIKSDAIRGLEGELGELAVGLAGRLLAQGADMGLQERLVRHLAESVRAVPADDRELLRRDRGPAPVLVESAAALDDPSRAALAAALRDLLGGDPEVRFEVKPALVGGALVRVGGHVWDATVAAQLEAARAAIHEGDDAGPRSGDL